MAWWHEFYTSVDKKSIKELESWFSDDIVLQFGNWPHVHGRAAALETLDQFFGNISGISHTLLSAVSQDGLTAVESIVTYTRLDGSNVPLPAATLLERDGEKIKSLRIYVDQAPLFAAP